METPDIETLEGMTRMRDAERLDPPDCEEVGDGDGDERDSEG